MPLRALPLPVSRDWYISVGCQGMFSCDIVVRLDLMAGWHRVPSLTFHAICVLDTMCFSLRALTIVQV